MKNKDIHKNLTDRTVRDFLAQGVDGAYIGEVARIELKIDQLENNLLNARNREASLRLIKLNGWEVFDISDEIYYNPNTYFPFIGTKKEHDALLKALESE